MTNKEYTYDIGKYTIGVDENGEDGIGMTVAKVENGEIYFLGNCYGENARCIDSLIQENQLLKKQLEERNIEYFKGAYDTHNKYYDQQQEFIKWLEDKIHAIETTYSQINGNYGLMNEKLEALKEVLREYKKIIGVENENKTTI